MRFLNLTPHAIGLQREDGSIYVLDGTREPARIVTEQGKSMGAVEGVQLYASPRFDQVINLPKWQPDVILIVSQLTALAVAGLYPERLDVFYPATGLAEGAQRDSRGVLTTNRLIRAN